MSALRIELRSVSIDEGVFPASHELSSWCVGEPTGNRELHDEGFPAEVPIMDIPKEPARQEMGEPMKWRV